MLNTLKQALIHANFILAKGANDNEKQYLESQLNIKFEPLIIDIYQQFNGATSESEQWFSYQEIPTVQYKICQFLQSHFGEHWQEKSLPDYDPDDGVLNTLFHPKWLPFYCNHFGQYFCFDYSQSRESSIISISIDEEDGDYSVILIANSFSQWLEDYWFSDYHLDNESYSNLVEGFMKDFGILDEKGEFISSPENQ